MNDAIAIIYDGANVDMTNPLPATPAIGGVLVSPANPLPITGTVTATVPNPLPISGNVGIAGTPSVTATVVGTPNVKITNDVGSPGNITPVVAGAVVDVANAMPARLVQGTTLNSATNPIFNAPVVAGAVVSAGNPLPVTGGGGAAETKYYNPATSAWNNAAVSGEVVALTSAVRSSTTNSSTITQQGNAGCVIVFDMTAYTGGQTVTPKLQELDPASAKWIDVYTGSARGSVFTDRYLIHPAYTPGVGDRNALTRNFRIRCEHSGAGNFTYSVGIQYVP